MQRKKSRNTADIFFIVLNLMLALIVLGVNIGFYIILPKTTQEKYIIQSITVPADNTVYTAKELKEVRFKNTFKENKVIVELIEGELLTFDTDEVIVSCEKQYVKTELNRSNPQLAEMIAFSILITGFSIFLFSAHIKAAIEDIRRLRLMKTNQRTTIKL